MEAFGIDVAKWNGSINWPKVAAAGKSFVILKAANKQNKTEESFEANYVGAVAAGLKVGAYKYLYATTKPEAKLEAEAIVKACGDKNIELGIWLDMEWDGQLKLSKAALTEIIDTEAEILKAAGFKVGIYCNKYWYDSILDSKSLATRFPFWIARYPNNDVGEYKSNSSLAPRSYAQAWQYSSKGKVPGITGNVDLDVCYTDLAVLMQPDTEKALNLMVLSSTQRKQLQTILNDLGLRDYEGKKLVIDGNPGPRTNYALEEFCRWYLQEKS